MNWIELIWWSIQQSHQVVWLADLPRLVLHWLRTTNIAHPRNGSTRERRASSKYITDRMATLHAHVGEWLLNLLALDRLRAPPIYRKPGYCRQTHKRHGARSPPSYSCSWLAQHHIPGARHVTCVSHAQAYLAYRINNNQQQKQPD